MIGRCVVGEKCLVPRTGYNSALILLEGYLPSQPVNLLMKKYEKRFPASNCSFHVIHQTDSSIKS